MRRVHPDLFDVDRADFTKVFRETYQKDGPNIRLMLEVERWLTRNAYEEVRGVFSRENIVSDEDKPGLIEDLATFYQRYGLSTGLEHTKQLVRDFEAQAASQAKAAGQKEV